MTSRPIPRDFEQHVELDEQGNLIAGHGQTQQLAAITAYAANVADVVGRLLQLGPSVAVDATLERSTLLVLRNPAGRVTGGGLRGEATLRRLRAKLET